jgi:hypothetical protein
LNIKSWSNELVTEAHLERKEPTPVEMANLTVHIEDPNRAMQAYPERTEANPEEMKSAVVQQEIPTEEAMVVTTGALKD